MRNWILQLQICQKRQAACGPGWFSRFFFQWKSRGWCVWPVESGWNRELMCFFYYSQNLEMPTISKLSYFSISASRWCKRKLRIKQVVIVNLGRGNTTTLTANSQGVSQRPKLRRIPPRPFTGWCLHGRKASPRISQREGSSVSTPSGGTQCPRPASHYRRCDGFTTSL